MVQLSVLDHVLMPPGVGAHEALNEAVESAVLAESLGYERIWFSEHHNAAGLACTAPELIIARAAAATGAIRVGAGGIMLPNHAPLKVAELFNTLEAMYPGRIDLGLGRAPGTDGRTATALRGSREAVVDVDFAAMAADLFGFLDGDLPDDHPFARVRADPAVPAPPRVWMLGSSEHGSAYAAAHGLPFCFAHQIDPDYAVPLLRRYRDAFRPSARAAAPYSSVSVIAFAAEDPEPAEDFTAFWSLHTARARSGERVATSLGQAREFRSGPGYAATARAAADRIVAGTPEQVGRRLRALAEQAHADEVLVATPMPDGAARRRSFELLAAEFGLTPHREAPASRY
ncbi:MsnO8 family LLM class oxidoreductase [Nocardiopsis mangrovi]|uniref:MsnO8 family LLM class oxidoreductase n=1 Tax=Nocardiopsis mangrovi TaxID=1179818 RepID=A0ABV9DQW5_9ACTN